ncbi:MAG: DNA repair exonuclease [Albidovulum sp.]|nr:DNA repair exonuclease [Albidovulum sp.]
MTFRFIHTADVHLDSPLRSLALKNEELADLIRNCSRDAFENIVEQSIELKVDALIVAGDLFDGEVRSMKTAAFVSNQMRRLNSAGIQVFMVKGNHDAESKIATQIPMPDNVHIFSGRSVTRRVEEAGIAIHGVSFPGRHIAESLLPRFPRPVDDFFNIGVLHTSLGGSAGHDAYAPCSENDLAALGYDYWALGHIHKRSVANEHPYIVMPGIPQGRDIGESGPKSATLVEVSNGKATIGEIAAAKAEFVLVPVNVAAISDWEQLLSILLEKLSEAGRNAVAPTVVARIALEGASPLHWRIRTGRDILHEQLEEEVSSMDGIWIEKIETRTMPSNPESDAADPIDELLNHLRSLSSDPSFRKQARDEWDSLLKQLPRNIRADWGAMPPDEVDDLLHCLTVDGGEDIAASLKLERTGQ